MHSHFDYNKYARYLQAVASMSRLYSDNRVPYVDSRFVEKLFVRVSGAVDLGRSDKSFDAIVSPNIGVGVKTFLAESGKAKREKVAEFTRFAQDGEFLGLAPEQLALKVSAFRNNRVISDANELAIDMDKSIYHCLVRTKDGAVVHEEPYRTIDIGNIAPTDNRGNPISSWSSAARGVFFTDQISNYNFNISKNVLFKEFKIIAKPDVISLEIFDNIFDRVLNWYDEGKNRDFGVYDAADNEMLRMDIEPTLKPGVDYVVLPLYSTRRVEKEVALKSGVNQWNAGGRLRKFGETYIPIPIAVHVINPSFFPDRDVDFELILPNSETRVPSKVCQEGRKALMSNPNTTLGNWIIKVLKPNLTDSDFERPTSSTDRPISYRDLVSIGKDSVLVKKFKNGSKTVYSVEFAPLDSYEDFISQF